MAKTTPEAFNDFFDRIKPSDALNRTIEARKNAVIDVLKAAFPSSSTLRYRSTTLIGSIGRKTASKPIDDIDLLVHLHVDTDLWNSTYRNDSSKFLYRVRDGIKNATTVQKVGARGQAVRLFYADGPTVDIAAVEKYSSGAFAIPDGTGGWLSTNPVVHADYIDKKNAELSNNLKRFVQVVRQWNHAHSSYLHSFHFEMLAARTFTSLSANRRTALKIFFKHNYNNLSVNDPAGFSGDLSTYLTTSQRQAVNLNIARAYDQATKAIDAENRGNEQEAIRLWRVILGDDFPSYG